MHPVLSPVEVEADVHLADRHTLDWVVTLQVDCLASFHQQQAVGSIVQPVHSDLADYNYSDWTHDCSVGRCIDIACLDDSLFHWGCHSTWTNRVLSALACNTGCVVADVFH